ncbi:YigZ family protein [Colwellia hornerae]|uniref:YigZ family protein n=1 Tax=Colwellia hornerae TaxID=89402 RepID=A0A5C6Q6Y9_9GAMM|nr:YigZ family protein [Colwellia hornerae]TWX49153.1 YigZ family protein [Colwellia hornerae]TWX55580.1 YigZ family protein [Colwellia hornerae]TWX64482.1 YigZ family protein [Colwellia hornerae]
MAKPYQIAANNVVDETIVSRSRFICFISPCSSHEEAKQQLKKCQQLHPQASHHCYAFLTGRPEDSQGYGFSDDGEPSGTAGRPMLSVLQGSDIGELSAIVVRYFGGTKLGTGGLQRAYGGSVRQALLLLATTTKVPMVEQQLTCDYGQINDVLYFVEQAKGEIIQQDFAAQIALVIALPEAQLIKVKQQLQTLSSGLLNLRDKD